MPNIKKVDVSEKCIYGLQTTTQNSDEMHQQTQKIGALWGRYGEEVLPRLTEGTALYGVYHHYESDRYGKYDVLVGSEVASEGLDAVVLSEGRYLRFPAHGSRPQAIISAWEQVWAYFEDPSIDERRAYETDFEHYVSEEEAYIYIGVHYF